jgi:hypothetical protein
VFEDFLAGALITSEEREIIENSWLANVAGLAPDERAAAPTRGAPDLGRERGRVLQVAGIPLTAREHFGILRLLASRR